MIPHTTEEIQRQVEFHRWLDTVIEDGKTKLGLSIRDERVALLQKGVELDRIEELVESNGG